MHISDYPDNTSGCCLITGVSEDPEGFLNLERPANPQNARGNAVVSISFLRELAPEIGLSAPADVQALYAEIAGLKLEKVLLEAERNQFEKEAEALYTLCGPKLWGKAQHVRKNAGFRGRQQIRAIQQYAKDEITEEEFNQKMQVEPEPDLGVE